MWKSLETLPKCRHSLSSMLLLMLPVAFNIVAKSNSFVIGAEATPAISDGGPIVYWEGAALLTLRALLGIRSHYWPRKEDPCSSWIGISCTNGHVIAISLSGLRRTPSGAMHPVFALDPLRNLSSLANFNSSGFAMEGSIPDWFGALSTLEHLDLSSSSINSSIPASLGGLANLQTFAIAKNNLTGPIPSSLGSLTSLIFLDLSTNHLTGPIPESLGNLKNLVTFNLQSNQLSGQMYSEFASFVQLQDLQLGNNAFQGPIPDQFGNLTFLRNLDLSFNRLSGVIPSSLGRAASLVTLTLSNNFLSGEIPKQLSNCTQLQTLSLDANSLTGSFPSSFGNLINLNTLSLFSNNLTGVLPDEFGRWTQVRSVFLSNNYFYGTIPSSMSDLSKIGLLDLSKNYLEGTPPVPLVSKALLDKNCLTVIPDQRSLSICKTFYLSRGILFEGMITSPPPALPLAANNNEFSESNQLAPTLAGVFGGIGFVILVTLLVFYILKKQKKIHKKQTNDLRTDCKAVAQPFPGNVTVNLLCLGENFSYTQLQQATGNFNEANLLKAGHSGDFYQGLVEGYMSIVVKRIDLTKFGKESYLSELDLFGKASHPRLVPLLGHCLEEENEKFLVYKYMSGRDLGYALQTKSVRSSSENSLQSLDWITRLKIAIGAAEGLAHLHHECIPPLVHRDICASSIFLDDKYEVRLGSLSEARVAVGEARQGVVARLLRRSQTSEQGDAGATAFTCAHDVFSFGKVLLELVTGKLGISGSTDPSTDAWLEWALSFINVNDKEPISKIMDPCLIVDEDLMEEVWAVSIVAKSCLNPKSNKRPLMRYILKALENPLKVVREDPSVGSARLQTSSRGSWNGAFFGSWHQVSSETAVIPGSLREEYLQKSKLGLNRVSQGSSGPVEISFSQRRPGSSEIFPEPLDDSIIQAPTKDSGKTSA